MWINYVRERPFMVGVIVDNFVIFSLDEVQTSIIAKCSPFDIYDDLYCQERNKYSRQNNISYTRN